MTTYREPAPRPPEALPPRPKMLVWHDFRHASMLLGLGIGHAISGVLLPGSCLPRFTVAGLLFLLGGIMIFFTRRDRIRVWNLTHGGV